MAEAVAPGGIESVYVSLGRGCFKDFFGQVHIGADIHGQLRIAESVEVAVEAGRFHERCPVGEDVVMRRHDDQCFRFLADDQAGSRLYGPDRGVYLSQFIAADFRQHNRRMGK